MSDLEGFGQSRRQEKPSRPRDTRKPAAQRPASGERSPRPRRKVDLDAVPEGYDANVWELALFFESQAHHYGHELAAGRPVLYAKLEDRFEKSDIRNVTSYRGKPLRWVPLVKVMMMDFWDKEVWLASVAYAIDQFCGVETFSKLKRAILLSQEVKVARTDMEPQAVSTGFPPEGIRRRAERQRAQEGVPVPAPRTRPRRSWAEIRAAVDRINGRVSE